MKKKLITIGLVLSLLPVVGFTRHPESPDLALFVPSTPTSVASYKVVDVMPSFWQFWETLQTLDETAKIRLFRELVLQPNKEVFEGFTGTSSDARLARYFVNVQPYIPGMRRFSERLETELPRYGRVFKKKFPDANGNGTIYFMPNLLEDGMRAAAILVDIPFWFSGLIKSKNSNTTDSTCPHLFTPTSSIFPLTT